MHTTDYDYDDHGRGEGGTFLIGFAMGVIGGAAAALLYAPREGREIRNYLAERAREGKQRAAEAAERGREAVKEGRHVIDQGKEVVANAIQEGRDAYRRTKTREAI